MQTQVFIFLLFFSDIMVVARLSLLCERMIESLSVVILLHDIHKCNTYVKVNFMKKIGSKTFVHI